MKIATLFIIVLGLIWLGPSKPIEAADQAPVNMVQGIDAKQALKIANQWRWTHKDITSYIDTREVVFKFPDGNITEIPLPKDEVMIAVAPYIKNTHE